MESNESDKANEKRKRGLWSPEEDMKLYNYITTFGVDSWSSLPQNAGLQRCEKSCRLRWVNHLDPNLKKCPISPEEKRLIISLHNIFGNSWSKIAENLPGRTDNEIKNFWNCHMKTKFRKLGLGASSEEPSSCSRNQQDILQPSEYVFGTTHIECENRMQTHKTVGKLKATMPCYNPTPISSTPEISYANNDQGLETENGTHNLGSQSSQIEAEELEGLMNLRDYMSSLSTLMNGDEEFGSDLRDEN